MQLDDEHWQAHVHEEQLKEVKKYEFIKAQEELQVIHQQEYNYLETALLDKREEINKNWIAQYNYAVSEMERERACILEAQEHEEQYERNQLWENKPITFRPSTHYFRLLKVEQEASKQKMFARAHENRLAKEEQHRRDYEKYIEQVKVKIDR